MERIDHYTLDDTNLQNAVAGLWQFASQIAKRALAVFAILGLVYGLVAAEVELAKIEQITEPLPR